MKFPFTTCVLSASLLLGSLTIQSEASVLLARYIVDGDTKGTLTDSGGVDPAANGSWSGASTSGPDIVSGIDGFSGDVLNYQIHVPGVYANQPITLAHSGEGGRLATDFSAEGGFTINLRVSLKSLSDISSPMVLAARWAIASDPSMSYRSFLLGINYDSSQQGYRFYAGVSGDSVTVQYIYTQAGIVAEGIYDVSFVYIPGTSITLSATGVGDTLDLEAATSAGGHIPTALFLSSETHSVQPIRIGGTTGLGSLRNAYLDNIEIYAAIPEPNTMVMITGGGLLLGLWALRRRKGVT